jgi:DNA mismatch repair ATPase MutS
MTISCAQPNQSKEEKLKLCVGNAFFLHGSQDPLINEELLQTLDSLNVFSHVIPTLTQTHLACGQFIIAKNFTQVTDDFQQLEKRQKLLTYLSEHQELKEELENHIKSLIECEADVLERFYPQPKTEADKALESFGLKLAIKTINGISSVNDYIDNATKPIGYRPYYLELRQRLIQLSLLYMFKNASDDLWNFNKIARAQQNSYDSLQAVMAAAKDTTDLGKSCTECGTNLFQVKMQKISIDISKDINRQPSLYFQAKTAVGFFMPVLHMYSLGNVMRAFFHDIYKKQKNLMQLRRMLKTTQNIHKLLSQHPEIANLIPGHEKITQLATYKDESNKAISDNLKYFLTLLNSSTFKGQQSFYFSFQGKITEAHNEFTLIAHELVPFFEAFGNIDAQLWAVKLLQRTDAQFCIPTWIKSDQPVLENIDFWHPMINPEKVVKNSMHVGGKAKATNVVITGSNAGGKTTSLTAVMLGQIMAQSLGVAPSKALRSTPFAKFHTYLDISTNLANNESLFMAQANRAAKLQNSIRSCTADQKSLSLLDEIFTGTRADFAEKASYGFAKNLGENKHSICLLATHFPKLTELEKLKTFINYKTQDATITAQGDLVYPYKIVPGISDQNIAQHILQQKGILKKA